MKSVLIGIVAAIAVAFAAQAAYNTFSTENNKTNTPSAAVTAQPTDSSWTEQNTAAEETAPLAKVAQQQTAPVVVAQKNSSRTTSVTQNTTRPTTSANVQAKAVGSLTEEKETSKDHASSDDGTSVEKAEQKTEVTTVEKAERKTEVATVEKAERKTDTFQSTASEPAANIASYEFAFVAPQAVAAFSEVSAANEQATQNVYVTEEETLSPSAPR